jgi:hypothetical protein
VRRVLTSIAARTVEADPAWQLYLTHLEMTYGPGGTFEGAFTGGGSAEDALMPLVADLFPAGEREQLRPRSTAPSGRLNTVPQR